MLNVGEVLDALAAKRGERAGISARTLNLVAFVEDPRATERVLERMQTLAARYPCRALFLDASQSMGGIHVRSECTQHDDTLLTKAELVQLNVAGIEAPGLRCAVRELLVPNVDTLLLWAGKHLNDGRFEALASIARSTVIDSSRAQSGKQALRELLLAGPHINWAVRDTAFMRLLPWQDMIAQFFDDLELAAELTTISHVQTITGSEPEAYYFAGWLASRLRWQPCAVDTFRTEQGERVAVSARFEGEPRRVRGMLLQSANCTFEAKIDERASDLVCLTVSGSKSRRKRCAPLREVDFLSLVEAAIRAPRSSEMFIESLQMANRLLDQASAP